MINNKTPIKILIAGGHGQLGWELQQIFNAVKIEFIALTQAQLDITLNTQIKKQLDKYKPTIVINAAAYTAVDQAEKEKELAYQCNAEGASLLAQNCGQQNIPLIHISTDYVFNGNKNFPYLETDLPAPINIYGASKLQGELLVQKYQPQHIILRVSGIFGLHGHNFVKTMLKLAHEKNEIKVVDDQITCPTPANDIAAVILQIIKKIISRPNLWGIYNYCASNPISWYQFASAIINIAQQHTKLNVTKITPISSKEFNSLAKRPMHSVLDCNKIKKTFNIEQKSWLIALTQIIQELLS